MAKIFVGAILLPVIVGIVISFMIESACRPRPGSPSQRPFSALVIHAGVWLAVFVAELGAFRRPWFAAANVDALFLFLVLVNNAKFHSLREPFVFQDFDYFTDALKHPRLFIPFFGLWRLVLAIAVIVSAILAGMALETRMTATLTTVEFLAGLASLAALAVAVLAGASRWLAMTQHDPVADLARLGLVAFWWRYAADELRAAPVREQNAFVGAFKAGAEKPDLVVVQGESFFDARRCFASVKDDVLPEYDALKEASLSHGTLQVAAWGANTVRTEFAFLSGLDPCSLGVHRFNPYRRLAQTGVSTVASYLKAAGYRTVCVHPYPASFYRRDQVFPIMGFDEFIDIASFADADRVGAFVSDLAVADRIGRLLDRDAQARPLFVFAITMENHGPLHLESPVADDVPRFLRSPPSPRCRDLIVYLRHLNNSDRMLGELRRRLQASGRAAGLCFYGDHVPIMPEVYSELGTPDGLTDYLIWKTKGGRGRTSPAPMRIQDLAVCLLESMELSAV